MKKTKPQICEQAYHESFRSTFVHFLASTEYVGIQECIPPDPPLALGRCRRCRTTISFRLSERQIAQLTGKAQTRTYYRFPLDEQAKKMIAKLAREIDSQRWGGAGPRYTFRQIAAKLVELKLAKSEPDPATVRRVVVASGVKRKG